MSSPLDEIGQVSKCARGDYIKLSVQVQFFDTPGMDSDIRQAKLCLYLCQESCLLVHCINQRDMHFGTGGLRPDGKHHTGKAAPRTDVQYIARVDERRNCRKRVDQMLDKHLLWIAYRGQVIDSIPFRQ